MKPLIYLNSLQTKLALFGLAVTAGIFGMTNSARADHITNCTRNFPNSTYEYCYGAEVYPDTNEYFSRISGTWFESGGATGQGHAIIRMGDGSGMVWDLQDWNFQGNASGSLSVDCPDTDCDWADGFVQAYETVTAGFDAATTDNCGDPTASNYLGPGPCDYPPPPSGPAPFFVTNVTDCYDAGKYDITWQNNGDVDDYTIEAKHWSSGSWFVVESGIAGNQNSRTVSVNPWNDTYFRIRAFNSGGSVLSDEPPDTISCAIEGDIKANGSDGPVSIGYDTAATISWSSTSPSNANLDCSVSPTAWTGTSNAGISTGNLTGSRTYTLTCEGYGGAMEDTNAVTVNVNAATGTVIVNTNVATNWSLNGPEPASCSGCSSTNYTRNIGDYNLTGVPNLAGYAPPVVAPTQGSNQSLVYNGTISWNIAYGPEQTTIVDVVTATCRQLTVQWTNVANETGYQVWRSTTNQAFNFGSGDGWTNVASKGVDVLSHVDSSITPGANYWYIVVTTGPTGSTPSYSYGPSTPLECLANIDNSRKRIHQVTSAGIPSPYAGQLIKDGDIITFRFTLINSGSASDSADISGIDDVMTPNMINMANASVDKGSGFTPVTITGNRIDVTGIMTPGTNWVVQFDATAIVGAGASPLYRNDGTILCTGETYGADCSVVRRVTHLNTAGGPRPPDFREVAP